MSKVAVVKLPKGMGMKVVSVCETDEASLCVKDVECKKPAEAAAGGEKKEGECAEGQKPEGECAGQPAAAGATT